MLNFYLQWGAAVFEFGTTWLLIQKDGKIYKEDLRGVYDVSYPHCCFQSARGFTWGELWLIRSTLQGSLFWKIAADRKQGKGWHQGYGFGGDGFIGSSKMM